MSANDDIPAQASAPGGGGSLTSRQVDDAGTQALTEALSSSFKIVKILMLLLVVVFFASGVFTVHPNENAVVLRFGRPTGTESDQLLKPGLHWAFPYPIDEIVRVPVGESHTVTSTAGWYAISDAEAAAGVTPMALPYLRPGVDGYTLTSDGNIIHVKATVKYRVSDPVTYAFRFVDTEALMEDILNNALYYASAQFTADEAMYGNKVAFKEAVIGRVRSKVLSLNLGVELEPSDVVVEAPLDVRQAFDAVLSAQQDRGKSISQAQGYQEEVRGKAEGEAKAIISSGLISSNRLVQAVSAEAKYFNKMLPDYQRHPSLFKSRLLTETMSRVLALSQDKIYLPSRADGQSRELRLMLSREPQIPERENPRPTAP